ncbi:MAG: hypothetical protein C4560_01045 [Nitrospiraceae bacterium]|nr:MAG: hypothetical protein C4560_01045 [Nitrospiraceae bacterium]
MSEVKVRKLPYGGWNNCISIGNGTIELIVTTDVGPRIIRYGFTGRENELCEVESTKGLTGGDEWRIYGGHRLWHSPESRQRTYGPDNSPVQWQEITDGIRTRQDIEPDTRIAKEMEITIAADSSVKILHRLTNTGTWPVELAVWSITAMATGGREIIPQTGRDTGLLPNRFISLWPYTKLNDPRLCFGNKYIMLRQDPGTKAPLKIGTSNENGWAAYFNHNRLFIKYYRHFPNTGYPDFGVSYETYVNDFMLEMETLSPLSLLVPGKHAEHAERWELFDNVPMPSDDEAEIDKALTGRVQTVRT